MPRQRASVRAKCGAFCRGWRHVSCRRWRETLSNPGNSCGDDSFCFCRWPPALAIRGGDKGAAVTELIPSARNGMMEQEGVAASKTEVRDGMKIDWDVPIPMDDGIILRADVFRPTADGRYPPLLTYGPYG